MTFGHLHQRKFAQKYANFAKVGSKFCQILNKPLKIAQDFDDFAKVTKFRQIVSHCSRYLVQIPFLSSKCLGRNKCVKLNDTIVMQGMETTSVTRQLVGSIKILHRKFYTRHIF